jgi:hypothetical protein
MQILNNDKNIFVKYNSKNNEAENSATEQGFDKDSI